MKWRPIKRSLRYLLFLFFFTIAAAEGILRIYNPFKTSVVGDKIVLTPNYSKVYINDGSFKTLDKRIIYKRNSIGLRGPEPPVNVKDYLSIITVGGSTTECTYISEGKTWEDRLNQRLQDSLQTAWVNNAGMDGHSTFGHIILLRDYVCALKPKVCMFLVGCNDVNRTDLPPGDNRFTKTREGWILTMAKYSRLVNTLLAFYRNHLAKEKNVGYKIKWNLETRSHFVIPDSVIKQMKSKQIPLIPKYSDRLKQLIKLCRDSAIEPIFITQPTLVGIGIDSVTKVDLATVNVGQGLNGKVYQEELEMYNDETRKVCAAERCLLIDLAKEMPKSTFYFYDAVHYTNEGCSKVADIIAANLIPFFKNKYPRYALSAKAISTKSQ